MYKLFIITDILVLDLVPVNDVHWIVLRNIPMEEKTFYKPFVVEHNSVHV